MNYLSITFLIFLAVFLILYYRIKPEYRYIALFAGSWFFYGFANPKLLLVLAAVTLIAYAGGLAIARSGSVRAYRLSFFFEILILVVFKYTSFLLTNINHIWERLFSTGFVNWNWDLILPVGLSFMIFQACSYLSDVYRKHIPAEHNLVRFAAFTAFFPTVLSGPIQKARKLLPQIVMPAPFEYEQAKKGTLLFVWGVFEKVMVANKLYPIYNGIFADWQNRSSAELLLAAVSFSFYIYADFSSYSDMSRGIGKFLGIDVGKNFRNPYLSQSLSEFWNRWHISLNEWFIENVYIPLGGNRKGTLRKYVNMLAVFFISGLWHGANWHFVAWGVINGVLVVAGQVLRPLKTKVYRAMHVDEKLESIVYVKRVIVFFLITFTWVFFSCGIMDSLQICRRILLFNWLSLFDSGLFEIAGTAVRTAAAMLSAVVFCKVQLKRQDERAAYAIYSRQPFLAQCLLLSVLIVICIFGVCITDANVDMRFLYFQF